MKHHAKMLLNACTKFSTIVPKRSSLPICETVKFDNMGITGTNLEVYGFIPYPNLPTVCINYLELVETLKAINGIFDIEIEVKSEISQNNQYSITNPDGDICEKRLFQHHVLEFYTELLQKDLGIIDNEGTEIEDLNSEIDFETCVKELAEINYIVTLVKEQVTTDYTNVIFTTNSGSIKLSGMNYEEFPLMPEFKAEQKTVVPNLTDYIPFVSTDELRPAMNGILIGKNIASTDAHVLYCSHLNTDFNPSDKPFIIPSNVAKLIKEPVTCEVSDVNGKLYFENNFIVIFRLIDEIYPNYDAVIPQDNPNQFSVNRITLIKAIENILPFTNKTTRAIKFVFGTDGNLILAVQDIDSGKECSNTIKCELVSGEGLEIGFNGKFLLTTLKTCEPENIVFQMSAGNRALVINNEQGIKLVMPVLISERETA